VAAAVQQYLTNLQQQVQQQLLSQQNISAFESVERQVFVIPENVTNSLIVSATPRYQEEILKVIQDLDIRPPMVLVQVLIAEVTLDDTVEAGAEFGLQNSLVFNRGRAVPITANSPSDPGFNFNGMDRNPLTGLALLPNYPNENSLNQNTLAGQALSHFATGHTSALGYGGFVFSAASDSISILLRALMDENRLQILSRPQVMTMHNQPAYVQVGANVARPGESTITGTGAVQQSVDYVDTGLILSILPLINDDGVIVLGVEAERSALGSEADPNATEISSGAGGTIVIKPLNITKASTTISARDGQTVVFAGLIQKSNVFNSRRVPYLSDVPFIGNFFKFESSNERRSELLVIMTPHLIRDESDVELIKAQETERMSWCLADVVNLTGDWGLQGGSCAFCKNDAPLIFPDVDPTGTMHSPTPAETQYSSTAPSENRYVSGEDQSLLRPLPASAEGAIGASAPNFAPAPHGQGHPATMQPAQEVSPAAYRSVRLPAPQ
jgi:type II secretory pathway component GspD/PulD (secretin)